MSADLNQAFAARDHRRRAPPWLGLAAAVAMALAPLTLFPGAASARDIPAAGFTVDDVAAWLRAGGHQVEVLPGKDGGIGHVHTVIDGHGFGVYMFDCKDGRCGSIQFSAGFATHGKFDISRMNEWNRDNRWSRGYYDDVNDPWVEMDVDLTPGGTYELLDDELATWLSSLGRFINHYDL